MILRQLPIECTDRAWLDPDKFYRKKRTRQSKSIGLLCTNREKTSRLDRWDRCDHAPTGEVLTSACVQYTLGYARKSQWIRLINGLGACNTRRSGFAIFTSRKSIFAQWWLAFWHRKPTPTIRKPPVATEINRTFPSSFSTILITKQTAVFC